MYLRASEDGKEKTVLQWDSSAHTFTLDKEYRGIGRREKIHIPLKEDGKNDIDLRILIDHSSLELFLSGGKYTVTNWIFPQPSSFFYDIFAEGREIFIPDMRIIELG
jgi:beta-fructofuranosidase